MSLWSCTACPKTFARKGDLTRHKLIHTGIKPHICETCGKGFAQFSGLKTHRNVHSKAKPYICGIGTCTKAFGDPSSRTRHRKETHRREGAYKCTITDCGTRIKRRSAFIAHLRKHGLDPSSLDLGAVVLQSNDRAIPTSVRLASPGLENKNRHKIESRTVSPSLLCDDFSSYMPGDDGGASYSVGNSGWSGGDPLDCRRANWSPENDALLLGAMFDQTVDIGSLSFPHEIYTYLPSDFEDPLRFGNTVPLITPHSNLLALEPFLEAGSDGFQSSWSSPSSTYSALNTSSFDDVLSLASNVSQESLLHNFM